MSTGSSDSPPAPSNPTETEWRSRSRKTVARWTVFATALVVVALIGGSGIYLEIHSGKAGGGSPSASRVLIPAGTIDDFPGGQFDASEFETSGPAEINGSFTTTFGIVIFVMTPTQFESFIKTTVLTDGYNWTSGQYANETIDHVQVSVGPGAWDLVFDNTNLIDGTMVGYLSNLTLTPK